MKIKFKGIEIECDIDEFEEMVARGLLDKNLKAEDFKEFDIPKKTQKPSFPDVVALYGCRVYEPTELPKDPFPTVTAYGVQSLTPEPGRYNPVWPPRQDNTGTITFTDHTVGTGISCNDLAIGGNINAMTEEDKKKLNDIVNGENKDGQTNK